MLIADELLLLSLHETGRKNVSGDSLEPGLGGAALIELALRERIGVTPQDGPWRERGRITLTNLDPTDDSELDALLQHLATREGAKVKDLISGMSGKRITKRLIERLAGRLVAAGILGEDRSAVLGLKIWPTRDPGPKDEVLLRLHAALVDRTTPSERTVALISLLLATGLLTKVVGAGPDGKHGLKQRAKTLSEGDWAAKAVKQAIDEVTAVSVAVIAGASGAAGGS